MKILMVCAELAPWAKTGGLADAVAGLTDALGAAGHDVRVLLPRYSHVEPPRGNRHILEALGRTLARQVTAHATPVGSGTVARTERISIERRAESAVIAWMRHQTTAYDSMKIERVAGRRREVRRELATISRAVLDLHRRDVVHAAAACPLCVALARAR